VFAMVFSRPKAKLTWILQSYIGWTHVHGLGCRRK